MSDSSSDDSTSDEEDDHDDKYDGFDKWGELDHDAERINTTEGEGGDGNFAGITNRLAVCNLDWDRVGATDIFVALYSFCPTSSQTSGRKHNPIKRHGWDVFAKLSLLPILLSLTYFYMYNKGKGSSGLKSVKVYLSDFGRRRLAEEDQLGPEELRRERNSEQVAAGDRLEESDGEGLSDDNFAIGDSDYNEKEKKAREMVRKYQINRLRYYYAVAEFGDAKISEAVCESLDGTEYELSATRYSYLSAL